MQRISCGRTSTSRASLRRQRPSLRVELEPSVRSGAGPGIDFGAADGGEHG
jgi:hypothetical protein